MGRRHLPLKAEGIFGQSNQDEKWRLLCQKGFLLTQN